MCARTPPGFAADDDPDLRRVIAETVSTQTAWAEIQVAMVTAPRIRDVTDFLKEIFVAEADRLAGANPIRTRKPLSGR